MTHAQPPVPTAAESPDPVRTAAVRHARRGGGRARLFSAALAVAVLVAGATGCSGSGDGKGSAAAQAEVFGPKGYRGIAPGTAKDAALAGGALQSTPFSALEGCAFYTYHDGPAPDPAAIAAETAAVAKTKDTKAKADKAQADADAHRAGPGASAREYAEDAKRSADSAKLLADSATAIADELKLQATRDKAFESVGGAKFGTGGLKQLIAPPKARTAEGIGAGSTEQDLKKAYAKVEAVDGGFRLPIDGAAGWELFFAVDGGKVTAMSLFSTAVKC
ncbi:hypothetical protein [Kitasatospora sp. NPDC059571]|uniref:hypothetical protein n=1 Tax=Kitasatospora sp. NPDC059571 TaxID=3346871 RepID=UPI0036CD29DC